jgi:hypothetical protein
MMVLDMKEYLHVINSLNIHVIYSGPMWEEGIKGFAELVKVNLANDNIPGNMAKTIFSVFVEQVTNVMMYSAEKGQYIRPDKVLANVSLGTLMLGQKENRFFVQTRNAVNNKNIEGMKGKIDHLNTLDKKELRQYHRERLRNENDNPESKGAGLGLIEIARRATAPIGYRFEPYDDELSYFTMYVEIAQVDK